MRISDWSSDVCSSYLAAVAEVKVVSAAVTAPSTANTPSALAPNFCGVIGPTGASSYQTTVSPSASVTENLPSWAGPAPTFLYTAPPPRSEEHTTELQSLMRISYAVFCLKKKNEIHAAH